MQFFAKSSMSTALATVLALSATAPLTAQATPLGAGGGVVHQDSVDRIYAFECAQLPDGTVTGRLVSHQPSTQSFVHVEISSAMHIGPWLAVAGQVTAAMNAPPHLALGNTMFVVFVDNGTNGPVADQLASGHVPAAFGNPSIQQIIGLIGPPPPQAFSPFVNGNITIR